jgi:hypothetical protein
MIGYGTWVSTISGAVTVYSPTLDTLKLTNATLEELESRTENGTVERSEAQAMMEEMEKAIERGEQDIYCFSTRVVDSKGKILVAYFAQSAEQVPKEVSTIGFEYVY